MKNTLKILSTIGLVLCALGFMFKVQHWPGAGALIVFGSTLLFIYFLLAVSEAEPGKKFTSFLLNLGFAIFTLGTLFKIQHWPGANLLLTLGLGVFLPLFGLFKSFASLKLTEQKMAHFFFHIGSTILPMGVLFWIMHWPGTGIMFLVSILSLILIITSGVVIYSIEKKDNSFNRSSFVIIMFMILWLVQNVMTRIPRVILDNGVTISRDIETEIDKEIEYGNLMIESILSKNAIPESKITEIEKSVGETIEFIDKLKFEMLERSGELTGSYELINKRYNKNKPVVPSKIDLLFLSGKDNFDSPITTIFGINEHNITKPQGQGLKLWDNLLTYRSELIRILSGTKPKNISNYKDAKDLNKQCMAMLESMKVPEENRTALAELYMGLTKPERVKSFEEGTPDYHWIAFNFDRFPLVNAMVQLSRLELEVLQARTKALKILAAQEKEALSSESVKKQ
jgi:hypothetical protein